MTNNIRWGLDNLRPFSEMKTKLIWKGKYDEYGNRRMVDIAGCAMLLQKVETICETHKSCLRCTIAARAS